MPFLAIKSLLSRVQLVNNPITGHMIDHICIPFYYYSCCLGHTLHLLFSPDANDQNMPVQILGLVSTYFKDPSATPDVCGNLCSSSGEGTSTGGKVRIERDTCVS